MFQNQKNKAKIKFTINGKEKEMEVDVNKKLLYFIREDLALTGTKYGCGTGDCGACTVLINGIPVKSCQVPVSMVNGKEIITIEGISGKEGGLHPIQQAFVESGAVQCGYCTPAMILRVKAFLEKNPNPSRDEARRAISGALCRCTGYKKIVDAIILAAERMRMGQRDEKDIGAKSEGAIIGKSVERTDARRKVKGEAIYGYDYGTIAKRIFPDLLYTKIMRSPHAHAKIKSIDTSEAEKMDGVVKVFTYKNVPDIKFTTAGQSYPEPSPYDMKVLNEKVRFAGEPVAIIAAESEEIAEKAKDKIKVEYEKLPVILDPRKALERDDVKIHEGGNIVNEINVEVGDAEKALENSEVVIEREYETPLQKHGHLEPHACVARFDDRGKLIVETTSQVVFHVRRILGRILNMSVKDIRVKSWEIGGGFGDKQEMVVEHYAALIARETRRPTLVRFNREEQFILSRRRHAAKLKVRIGSDREGKLNAIHLDVISDAGAYGTHGVTVTSNMGAMTLPMYSKHCKNLKFTAKVVYTNKPQGGAMRGYGTTEGGFALECAIDELAEELGIDPVDLRIKNAVGEGDFDPISKVLSEAGKIIPREINSCGLIETLEKGRKLFGWDEKRRSKEKSSGPKKRGIGAASAMKGSGVLGFELSSSSIKLNEDGTVLVTIGASDMGQGLESVVSQIAAETIGIKLEDVEVISADTDRTMFSMGTYASSGTYMEGKAVENAAKDLKGKILEKAAKMMKRKIQDLETGDGEVYLKENPEESIKIAEVAKDAFYGESKIQLEGFGYAEDLASPPPFSTHFVEVEVDEDSGKVEIKKYLALTDVGVPINPREVEGQVEGGVAMGIGYALFEELKFDEDGHMKNPNFRDYKMPTSLDVPEIENVLVKTYEPTGPYGAKSAGEIGMVPPAPAIANAIYDAVGKRFRKLPITPEKILKELKLD